MRANHRTNYTSVDVDIPCVNIGAHIIDKVVDAALYTECKGKAGVVYLFYNIINILGAVFMDVFPEVAISWALQESKIGDIIGNLIKTLQNPEQVTSQVSNGNGSQTAKSAYKAKHRPTHVPPVLDDEDDDDMLSFKIRS